MSQRVYSTILKYSQVVVEGAPVAFDLPKLEPLTIRRMTVKISGWRVDSTDDDAPYTDSGFFGTREILATRGAVTGTPSSYPATFAVGQGTVAPTTITDQGGGAYGPCDLYDSGGFGLTANGLSPLNMAYLSGTGGVGAEATAGLDQLSIEFVPQEAGQYLAMTLLVGYEDQPIVLT